MERRRPLSEQQQQRIEEFSDRLRAEPKLTGRVVEKMADMPTQDYPPITPNDLQAISGIDEGSAQTLQQISETQRIELPTTYRRAIASTGPAASDVYESYVIDSELYPREILQQAQAAKKATKNVAQADLDFYKHQGNNMPQDISDRELLLRIKQEQPDLIESIEEAVENYKASKGANAKGADTF